MVVAYAGPDQQRCACHEPPLLPSRSTGPHRVRRTPAISCEAVAPVPRQRGHAAAPCVGVPGAAASLVSFIALFGGVAPRELIVRCRAPQRSRDAYFSPLAFLFVSASTCARFLLPAIQPSL